MSGDRVTYDDKGRLDEIFGSGFAHLERMRKNHWFLLIGHADGTQTALWFKSKNMPNLIETRSAPKRLGKTEQ
jgi:hypothetical protein